MGGSGFGQSSLLKSKVIVKPQCSQFRRSNKQTAANGLLHSDWFSFKACLSWLQWTPGWQTRPPLRETSRVKIKRTWKAKEKKLEIGYGRTCTLDTQQTKFWTSRKYNFVWLARKLGDSVKPYLSELFLTSTGKQELLNNTPLVKTWNCLDNIHTLKLQSLK